MKPITFLLAIGLGLGIASYTHPVCAQTSQPAALAVQAESQPSTVCPQSKHQPTTANTSASLPEAPLAPDPNRNEQAPFSVLLSRIFAFLAALGIAGFLLVQWTRRQGGFNPQKGTTGLCVLETRMLGNKQYLMVARYRESVFLLGVGPGYIHYLCSLSNVPPLSQSTDKSTI